MPNKKESQNIEWKQRWQDDHLKSIRGFANAQGGRIYIGKDDKGRIVGLKKSRKLLEDLPNKIRSHLGLMPDVNLLHEDGKDYDDIDEVAIARFKRDAATAGLSGKRRE